MIPFIRTAHNYDTNEASQASALFCGPGLTQQNFKEECDINVLLARFNVTGSVPITTLSASYGDFTGVRDYKTALNTIIEANESFDKLPSKVRNRFNNDPEEFLLFATDPNNLSELRKLGLTKQQKQEPDPPQDLAAPAQPDYVEPN